MEHTVLQWHLQAQAMNWCFFRSLGKGPGNRFHGLCAWTVFRKAGSQGFMWPFSQVQQWQWLVPEWLLGMNDPYVRLDLMWMGSLLVFFCVFPGLILQIIFSCSDTLEMTSTQHAQQNWQNHAFLHELGQLSTFSSSKIFEKKQKSCKMFPYQLYSKSGYNGYK